MTPRELRAVYNQALVFAAAGGQDPASSRRDAYQSAVAAWLESTHPATDDTGCACCGESSGQVVPVGAAGHRVAFLHPACIPTWSRRRLEAAQLALEAIGISPPVDDKKPTIPQEGRHG